MPYNPNIPQAPDFLSASQDQILQNFNLANQFIGTDHVNFTAGSNNGKHNKSTYPRQGASPSTNATEGVIFSRLSTHTGQTELVFRKENNGTQSEFTSGLNAVNGWTRLPSGMLLKWGTAVVAGGASAANFPVAATIPVFTAILNGIISVADITIPPNTFVTLRSINGVGINVYASARTSTANSPATFRYFVIGRG